MFKAALALIILIFPALLAAQTISVNDGSNLLLFSEKNPLSCMFVGSDGKLGIVDGSAFTLLKRSRQKKITKNLKELSSKELRRKRRSNPLYRGLTRKRFSNFRKKCRRFAPLTTPTPGANQTPGVSRTPTGVLPSIKLSQLVNGLSEPLYLTHSNDESGRLFVVEREGRIRIINNGTLLSTPFLDITDRVGSQSSEQGLLSVAFHPNYAQNGRFFVDYTNTAGDSVVAEYGVSGNPNQASRQERTLLSVDQPADNHNGGLLKFGPDGFLYIAFGDGGGGGDTFANGQNLGSFHGGLLRIDVNQGAPYAVPPDNPFVGVAGARPEKWAYGLRNPWRFSFDRVSGTLFLGDVGQGSLEEIDIITRGGNYGWNIMEGTSCFNAQSCNQNGLVLPVAEYGRSEGNSVTGGYVYRGPGFDNLYGKYIFGDFGSGRIWVLTPDGAAWRRDLVMDSSSLISSFGEDQSGNLYLVDYRGTIFQITPG